MHRGVPAYGFDVVPIWIQNERCIVRRVIRSSNSRRAIRSSASDERGLEELIYCFSRCRAKSKMQMWERQLRGDDAESPGLDAKANRVAVRHQKRQAERRKCKLIKAPACLEIAHREIEVIDHGESLCLTIELSGARAGDLPDDTALFK